MALRPQHVTCSGSWVSCAIIIIRWKTSNKVLGECVLGGFGERNSHGITESFLVREVTVKPLQVTSVLEDTPQVVNDHEHNGGVNGALLAENESRVRITGKLRAGYHLTQGALGLAGCDVRHRGGREGR